MPILLPRIGLETEFKASETRPITNWGIDELISPASSIKRVGISNFRATHVK